MLAKIRTDVFNNMFLTYIEEEDDECAITNKEYLKRELEDVEYNELFDWDNNLKNFELKPSKEYLIWWKIVKEEDCYVDVSCTPTIYKINEM